MLSYFSSGVSILKEKLSLLQDLRVELIVERKFYLVYTLFDY